MVRKQKFHQASSKNISLLTEPTKQLLVQAFRRRVSLSILYNKSRKIEIAFNMTSLGRKVKELPEHNMLLFHLHFNWEVDFPY
jgi:hypothetical protein